MTYPNHPASIYDRQLDHGLEAKYLKVAELLNPKSKVLELGCATGYFGAALTRLGHEVTGLESHPDAVDVCKGRGVNAIVADLSAADPLSCTNGNKFDAVLAMDLLEHLPNPESLLLAIRDVLLPDGRLIITGPNVAYWSVRLNLLLGRWQYAQAGIMDETHLRWFTRKSWRLLLEGAGFAVQIDEPAEIMLPKEQWLRRLGISGERLTRLRNMGGRWMPGLFTTVFLFGTRLPTVPVGNLRK